MGTKYDVAQTIIYNYFSPFSSIVVEFAKETRPRRERDTYEADRAPRGRRPPGYRLTVSGVSRDTSWQVCLFSLNPRLDPDSFPSPHGRLRPANHGNTPCCLTFCGSKLHLSRTVT